MAPKKKTSDKVPAGTSDAVDSGSTSNVTGGNGPTLDPSQAVSAASETNTIRPTTWSTCVTDQLTQPVSEQGTSEDPTQTPSPHEGSRDPLLPKTYSDYSELNPEELALGDQIQEMLNTINEHMDEVKTIHNMSHQVAQLLAKTNESNSALEARTRTLSDPKQALGKARAELLAKTVVLERLYADQAPAGHLNQVVTAAQSTHMDEDARETEIQDKPHKSIQYAPFNGIEDNDTDSETTVRNRWEGSVPFQQPDDRDILDMSNNESDNALV
ncbi:hypothetical protein M422DRAFT_267226 [Sphaerobolus stellatus SS14]|uniref:Uncharacterized protein n=1 Tax=Sphaerobolus stellatus (strain SS14) TaxID=990650 RepID=A0A0C9V0J7_SPHS4|nr:hypothetical protein M422DRAFT_267226 [Sphaerobolus stellatus SS14]